MPPKKKKQVLTYKHEDLLLALTAMKNGESALSVSKRFDIPRSTLIYKFSGKTPLERRMGPAPLLGNKNEEMLKNWVMGLAVKGFPVTKIDLLTSVEQIVKDMNLQEFFPNGKPGHKWLTLFLKRHPGISERVPEKLSKVRATVTESFIRNWFQEVKEYIEKNELVQVLDDPNRVFNMDETAFFLCPRGEKVLGIKGQRNVYEYHEGNEKENLTVLCNANAAGKVAPTLIVFPGQRLPQSVRLDVPEEWALAKSETGWINWEVFFEYFANVFYKWLLEQKITFPIVVFLDGHKSHLTYHLSKFCSDHQIVLIALPANCTHVMQPLDVAVFKPVKGGWSKSLHSWRMKKDGDRLTKFNFASMLKGVLIEAMKETTLANGFKRCGLCPLNPDAVDYTKVDIVNNSVSSVMDKKGKTFLEEPVLSSKENLDGVEKETHIAGIQCVNFMESFIDSSLLKEFEDTYTKFTPIWKGADRAHDLYVAWKKAKDFTAPSTRHQVTPVNTTDGTEPLDECCSLPFDPAVPTTSQMATNSNCSNSNNPTTLDQREKLAIAISPHNNGADVPSPFINNLFWPGTPTKSKRKNKKITVKLPSVISSKDWQDFEGKKREDKKLEEQKKIERKRQREEKKNNKVCKKKKTAKKKLVFDESEDLICKVCGRRYSAEIITQIRRRWIQCDECGHSYHYKCLPKKHLDIYGVEEDDEDDEVAFVCHKCTKDSDDEDLHLSSDDEEEDNDILASLKLL